ncbi:MAG: DMT family transporter [Candidatus Micrarchaeota archaeon]|nr:DMT family transporter [Candidatus Micrarchaeota archaeon]
MQNCGLVLALAEIVSIAILIIWSLSTTLERRLSVLSGRSRASIIIAAAGLIPIVAIFAFNSSFIGSYAILASVISGGFFTLGTLLYYKSLETEQVSNTAPTGLLQALPLIAFGVLALGEQISAFQICGAALMTFGVLLASTTRGSALNRKLLPAALANVSWAVYWIFASFAINLSGQFAAPILLSRIVSVTLALVVFGIFFRHHVLKLKRAGNTIALIAMFGITAGVLDGLGNALFAFATHINALHIASIFETPMLLLIALFGYLFYKERLTHLQKIGMAVAFAGALVIAIF